MCNMKVQHAVKSKKDKPKVMSNNEKICHFIDPLAILTLLFFRKTLKKIF